MFLTPAEVVELTHRTRSDAQVRALRFMGIEHKVRPDGSIAILQVHVEVVMGAGVTSQKLRKKTAPNWDALPNLSHAA